MIHPTASLTQEAAAAVGVLHQAPGRSCKWGLLPHSLSNLFLLGYPRAPPSIRINLDVFHSSTLGSEA